VLPQMASSGGKEPSAGDTSSTPEVSAISPTGSAGAAPALVSKKSGGGLDLIRRDSERRRIKRASGSKTGASKKDFFATMDSPGAKKGTAEKPPRPTAAQLAAAAEASGAAATGGSNFTGLSSISQQPGYASLTRTQKAATLLKGTRRLDEMVRCAPCNGSGCR
jgi:hypothetical protein